MSSKFKKSKGTSNVLALNNTDEKKETQESIGGEQNVVKKSATKIRLNQLADVLNKCKIDKTSVPLEIENEINTKFFELLDKLGVDEELRERIVTNHELHEKVTHLSEGVSVTDSNPNFSDEDGAMILTMDADKYIHSIMLLTCKHRILHASKEWMDSFFSAGGVSVLVENMDNRLEKQPLSSVDAAALLQLLTCLRHIMEFDGLQVAIDTRGAIDAFTMSLRFEYKPLALQVLELLSVICAYGGETAVWQVVQGINHLAKEREELPFAMLVEALATKDIEVKAAIITFVNALLMNETDIHQRISLRNTLFRVNFPQAYMHAKNNKDRSDSNITSKRRSSVAGDMIKLSAGFGVMGEDIQEGLAEDGVTRIHPEQGIMAGTALEQKKSKDGLKSRFYILNDGMLRWWELSKNRAVDAPNGCQSLTVVSEILQHTTSRRLQVGLQKEFGNNFAFEIHCTSNVKYQLGVKDKVTRDKWVFALNVAATVETQKRTAYQIKTRPLIDAEKTKFGLTFDKQVNIYELVSNVDRQNLIEDCKEEQKFESYDLAKFLSFELKSNDMEDNVTKMLQSLVSLSITSPEGQGALTSILNSLNPKKADEGDNSAAKKQDIVKKMMMSAQAKKTKQGSDAFKGMAVTSSPASDKNSEQLEILKAENAALRSQLEAAKGGKKDLWGSIVKSDGKGGGKLMTAMLSAAKEKAAADAKALSSTLPAPEETKSISSVATDTPNVSATKEIEDAKSSGAEKTETESVVDKNSALKNLFAAKAPAAATEAKPAAATEAKPAAATEAKPVKASGALGNLFGGRGAGPLGGRGPLGASPAVSGSASMKKAVTSSKAIPPPPHLPGTAPPSSGLSGPPMLGAVASLNTGPQKPKKQPKTKMKGLFWSKLKAKEVEKSIWQDLEEPELRWDNVEITFADIKNEADANAKSAAAGKKPKFTSLLDGKRTQNVGLVLGKLRKTPQEIVNVVIEMNTDVLNLEMTETLSNIVPTPEESTAIRNYDGKTEELDAPGRVFKLLIDIPRLEQRLKCQNIMLTWEQEGKALLGEIDLLHSAVHEFRSDFTMIPFRHLLALILSIGNHLNGGTTRGQAFGCKIDILSKIHNVAKASSVVKGNLLNFIVDEMKVTYPDEPTFYEGWLNMWKSHTVSLKQCELDLKQLEQKLTYCKTELITSTTEISDDDIRQPLKVALTKFKEEYEVRYNFLKKYFGETVIAVNEVFALFLEKPWDSKTEKCPSQNFFEVIVTFASLYIKSIQENENAIEKAKQAALKKEREEQKAAEKLLKDEAKKLEKETKADETKATQSAFQQFTESQNLSNDQLLATFQQKMGRRAAAMKKESDDEQSDNENDWNED